MSKDPIVEEVRAIRAKIAAEHGNDLEAIIRALKQKEGARRSTRRQSRGKRVPKKQTRKAG